MAGFRFYAVKPSTPASGATTSQTALHVDMSAMAFGQDRPRQRVST
jgi:hypothetical protein